MNTLLSEINDQRKKTILQLLKSNKIYISLSLLISIISWMFFKHYYPYPFLTYDSYLYLDIAANNNTVSNWPIGYPKFIHLISSISNSSNLLVSIQFFILQLSLIIFFITIKVTFEIRNSLLILLFLLLFINPIFLFTSNHILSDPLFIAFTILWYSQLIWITKVGNNFVIIFNAITIFLAFIFRYNAIYYPLINILTIISSPVRSRLKLIAILLSILLPYIFIQYTKSEFEKISGIKQYSYISGWKLASNALYMYNHIYKTDLTPPPAKFKILDSLSRKYFNENQYNFFDLRYAGDDPTLGSWFIFKADAPLMEYLHYLKKDNQKQDEWKNLEARNMAPLGPYYNDYGYYMIRKYPLAYFKYIIYPDILSYLCPFPENLTNSYEPFSIWNNEQGDIARTTFNLSSVKIPGKFIKLRYNLLNEFPTIFTCIHLLYLFILLYFLLNILRRRLSANKMTIISILNIICLTNFLFVILIHTSALRYEVFIIVLEIGLGVIMVNLLRNSIAQKTTDNVVKQAV